MVDPGGLRCPNHAVHAPLSVILPKLGIFAVPFATSPLLIIAAASWITDSSNPERPRPA
jgi:hypothetical protein